MSPIRALPMPDFLRSTTIFSISAASVFDHSGASVRYGLTEPEVPRLRACIRAILLIPPIATL
jgi:hypothetical protein